MPSRSSHTGSPSTANNDADARPRSVDPDDLIAEIVSLPSLKLEMQQFDVIPEELVTLFPKFREPIESSPSLRAAWLDLNNRLVVVARDELAARAEVDPRDPEPLIAAHALVGLGQVAKALREAQKAWKRHRGE